MFAKQVWFVTSFILSLLIVAAPVTRADSKEEAREAIQRACTEMDAALDKKDRDTYFSFYARDFISVDKKGEQKSLEETRRAMSQVLVPSNIKSSKFTTVIEKFTLEDDTATVLGRSVATIVTVNPQTGVPGVFVSETRFRGTWIKQDGRWLITKSEELDSKQTYDGKLLPE